MFNFGPGWEKRTTEVGKQTKKVFFKFSYDPVTKKRTFIRPIRKFSPHPSYDWNQDPLKPTGGEILFVLARI